MRAKKTSSRNRFLAGLLAVVMIVSMLPASVFAAETDSLTAALEKAKAYTDAITIDSASNDPATVVPKFKTHFTWDNEKRENSQSYLFDWSYYNGVVFEGIEYLYETTGKEAYKDYVVEYMSSMITKDGEWAVCSNNAYKQCAGYNATHGADCYKTASLLLDTYEMTGDKRYLTMAETLYADLDAAAASYSLSKAGGNYRHTWAINPSPDLWLDGLYMILPFRAEYAEYIEDTAELDLIVDRMQWVSDNMYNAKTGLFYHAADSASSNSGTYWLRSIGWYAAAIVDIMDCMEGENLEAMKAQLVKLVNGMKACQDSGNGMWLNNMAASESASNPYETSGTALVSYAVMKAVNKGWLDESYADMAIAAFEGICNEKLSGTTLTDICFKGVPSGSNSTFYDNEGKGVGPFIMLYAEVQEYVNYLESEPEVTEETFTFEDAGNILKVTATATAMSAKNVSGEVEAVAELLNDDYTAYEFSLNDWEKNTDITVVLSLGAAYDEQTLTVYYIDSNGTAESVSGNYVVGTDKDGFQIVTISDAAEGTYAFGTPYVKVDASATLTGLRITNVPDVTKYFIEETNEDGILPLDITGLVVEATYSDGTTKDIPWNEFGEVEDGYSLTVDMTVPGDQDVEVSYTYGEVTLRDFFTIVIYNETISAEDTTVSIQMTVPGVTAVTVTDNTAEEFVVAAAEKVLENYVSYDIELEGYTQGEEVTVTLPIPAGVEKAAVYYIPEDGSEPEDMGGANNGDGTISFTTDHFSTYAVGSRAGDVLEGTGNLAGGKVYTLDTNGVTADKNYLIVSANSGTGYALTNNNGYAGSTPVDISNSTIAVKDDSNIAWQFSGTTSGTVSNNGRYVYPGNNSLSLNPSGTSLTISNQGSGAYRIYRTETTSSGWWGEETTNYYYLRYRNNAWTGRTNSGNVYLYELTSSSSGEAVTFAIDPANTTVIPGGTLNLNGTVTVAGETVDLSKCDITWVSSDTDYATVSNGIVTGGTDGGSAVITASLTEVDGKALVTPIDLSVTVTVQSKEIDSAKLNGTVEDVAVGGTPDYSGVSMTVTYEDNTTATIPYNQLTFSSVDTSEPGGKTVTVSYGEWEDKLNFNVFISYDGLDKADPKKYPQYPADGAVRIDKTATHNATEFNRTGVTHVELDVAGISVKRGVDVVLVADISNSMAWKAGAKNTSPGTGETTKWQDLQAAAGSFVDTLLDGNDEDPSTNNTISFVTFGGFDAERNKGSYSGYFDATKTVFTSSQDAEAAKDKINSYSITGNDSAGYTVTIDGDNAGTPQGGTNYDYAFLEAASAIAQIKSDYADVNDGASYDDSGREIYVVFMTDGAPDHYNQLYYKSRSSSQFDYYALYQNDDDFLDKNYFDVEGNTLPSNYSFVQRQKSNGYYIPTGEMNNESWISWIQSDSLYVAEEVLKIESVNSITSVGFDLENGAFGRFTFGETVLTPVLQNLAGENTCDVFVTDDSAALEQFYAELATKIKFAGTAAQVTDTVGNNFSVQMAPYVLDNHGNQIALTTPPTITVKTYDLHPKGAKDDDGNDITGDRTGDSANIEVVTFNADGTEAYSNLVDVDEDGVYGVTVNANDTYTISDPDDNILTDASGNITISAKYFTYTKEAATSKETFVWTIGNITDKEIALAFDAYLEGSMAGERPEDVYYTNEEAILEYIDINGDYATQTFPIPAVAWGGATTTIRFYLVNEKGEPVNRDGEVIPWANRIYAGDPVVVNLNLNADLTIEAQTIQASAYVPSQFYLYDNNASYTVQTTSSEDAITGEITVSEPSPDAFKTTGTAPNAVTQTGAQTTKVISFEDPYYTWSYVGFGVRWDLTQEETDDPLNPDQIVIDYGKAIQVDVLANDPVREEYTRELVGFTVYNANTDLNYIQQNAGSATFNAKNGVFSIINNTVQFTPTKILPEVQRVFYVAKYTEKSNTENAYYVWGQLDVIPATSVYYETDFADGVFALTTTGTQWSTSSSTPAADGPQDPGTIGQNTYGYDTTYNNDSLLSNGSSLFVEGQGVKATTAKFSFTGTGFDIISRTGVDQGAIRVDVYSDASRNNRVKSVTVLNKSESNLELYQIPVVSVNDLAYGTYYVTIGVNAAYTNEAYPALSRGGEFYFDAVRIFDPVKGDKVAEAAYEADGEYAPQRTEVRQMLIEAGDFEAINTDSVDGMVFVDRGRDSVDVVTYKTIGPNNEVYLSEGQAIAFKMDVTTVPASFDIGAKAITGSSPTLKAVVFAADGTTVLAEIKETSIVSCTAQNFDLMSDALASKLAGGESVYVVITNTAAAVDSSDNVLSITDIKVAYGEFNPPVAAFASFGLRTASVDTETEDAVEDPYEVTYTVDAATYSVASAVLLSVEEEVPEEAPEAPETEEKPEAEKPKPGKPEKPDKEKPVKPEKPNKPDKDFEDDKSDKKENPNKNNKPGQAHNPGKQNNGKGNRK